LFSRNGKLHLSVVFAPTCILKKCHVFTKKCFI
jgi:hypothetical protein